MIPSGSEMNAREPPVLHLHNKINYLQRRLFPAVIDPLAPLRARDSGIVKFHFFSAAASLSRKP